MLFPPDNPICLPALCDCPCPTSTALKVDSRPPESLRRLKNSHCLKRPSSIGSDPRAGNSREVPWHCLFDGAQEKTRRREKNRGGRHWRGRRLRHLSPSDWGMRRENGNNYAWGDKQREKEAYLCKQGSTDAENTSISLMERSWRKTVTK